MDEYQADEKVRTKSRILTTLGLVVVAAFFVLLIIFNVTARQLPGDQVWNIETAIGDPEAKNYYIMYTDLMCPYCDVFSRQVMAHWEEFNNYLAANDIFFEVRLTDYLYEGSGNQASRDAAEGAYCAMREGKFWDYYHGALQSLWNDYHSKGIGSSKTAQPIGTLPEGYWLKIGRGIGLGDEFEKCVGEHEAVEEIMTNTRKAAQVANGMPYFKFNRFTSSGFDDTWGWEYVLYYLDAGLGK